MRSQFSLRWAFFLVLLTIPFLHAEDQARPAGTGYSAELDLVYATVNGKELKINAFLPPKTADGKPVAAMLDIHGGWWTTGSPEKNVENWYFKPFTSKGVALFTNSYRLGKEGGFPECIRDCRNAIRFLRKNAARFNIDPDRIGCFGGSAGGHLSMMLAMVPEDFDDGGPTEDLKGVSAKVCCAWPFVGPTDFIRQYNDAPSLEDPEGRKAKNDARFYFKTLFKGMLPDSPEHVEFYKRMCPIGHIRKDVSPMLVCDGELDPVVPGLHGKVLVEKLKEIGADATYWMTPHGGHAVPSGPGFPKVLDDFLTRTLKL